MGEEEKLNPKTGLDLEVELSNESIDHKMEDTNQLKEQFSTSSSKNTNANIHTGKSCKGCLYYSSHFKADSRNPLCVGLSRSLPNVPRYIVGESEMEASKKVRSLRDFRYACVGYSLYTDRKKQVADGQEMQTELPVCFGLEVIVDRSAPAPAPAPTPSPTHNREADGNGLPQRRTHKPTHSTGYEFLSRFKRNASLVANGVAKNVRKVGNQIKESVDDILYPYRRRPK